MFRRLLAIVLLVSLAVLVWYAARWVQHKDDLTATVIFDGPQTFVPGDQILLDQLVIGEVTKVVSLDEKTAVSIRVDREFRNDVLGDSLFVPYGASFPRYISIVNSIAVGRPVPDGAVIIAREDRLTRFLADGADRIAPTLKKLGAKAAQAWEDWDSQKFEQQLDEWETQMPEWRKQGDEVFQRNVESVKGTVAELEKSLREAGKSEEAEKIRSRFRQWLGELKPDNTNDG